MPEDNDTLTVLQRWRRAYELGKAHDLSAPERAVLLRTAFHVDRYFESETTIAEATGLHRLTVHKAHKSLTALGLLAEDKRRPGGPIITKSYLNL